MTNQIHLDQLESKVF